MKSEEITTLAREYAEEMIKGTPSEELPNCLKNSMLTMNTEYIAEIFQWLTRRYCLVERSKVVKSLIQARVLIEGGRRNHDSTKGNLGIGSEQTIYRLFPEIAKEVEG